MKNRTTDTEICHISEREQRVVITKDADFVNSFLLTRQPHKLLLISTGNMNNMDFESIFVPQIPAIAEALSTADFAEFTPTSVVIHV
jgi:predicted nuclease of predicted toxin-antitoxin system